jgi:hypothetical protein
MHVLSTLVLATAWPAGPGIEPFTRAFWIQQAMAAALTLVFLRWLHAVAGRRPRVRPPSNLLRFPANPR